VASLCDRDLRRDAVHALAPLATRTPVALLLIGALVAVHRHDFSLARALVPWVEAGGADRRVAAMLTAHALPEPLEEALIERGFRQGVGASNMIYEGDGDEAEHLRRRGDRYRRHGIWQARSPLSSDTPLVLVPDPLPEVTRAARADPGLGPAAAAWLLISSDPLDRREAVRRLRGEERIPVALGLLVARLDDPDETVRVQVWELLNEGRITQRHYGVADALQVAAEKAIDDPNERVRRGAYEWLPRRSRQYR
jgi:hypothetical protein